MQQAAVHATTDVDVAIRRMPHDAADLLNAHDVGRRYAVLDTVARAFRQSHDGSSTFAAVDFACHLKVLDGGTVDMAEWGDEVGSFKFGCHLIIYRGGDSVTISVERAAEYITFIGRTNHRRNADVAIQPYGPAAETAGVGYIVVKDVPVVSAVDDEGIGQNRVLDGKAIQVVTAGSVLFALIV